MSRIAEFETTIRGGLPVVVKAVIHPPERDIGIFEWQPEFELFWPKGGLICFPIPEADERRIERECLENM